MHNRSGSGRSFGHVIRTDRVMFGQGVCLCPVPSSRVEGAGGLMRGPK